MAFQVNLFTSAGSLKVLPVCIPHASPGLTPHIFVGKTKQKPRMVLHHLSAFSLVGKKSLLSRAQLSPAWLPPSQVGLPPGLSVYGGWFVCTSHLSLGFNLFTASPISVILLPRGKCLLTGHTTTVIFLEHTVCKCLSLRA